MSRILLVISVVVLCSVFGKAQGENPHAKQMERAHPTPIAQPSYEGLVYMVPMLTETVFPSIFVNANMIDEDFDALPAQNESSIAVNPRNPTSLIGSAVDYRSSGSTWAYYSKDAGATWKNVTLGSARPGWSSSNDPSVCFDHRGKGYLCYGGFKREGNVQFGENGIFISSTTDGGVTWPMKHTAVVIHTGQQNQDSAFEDKYYVHADTAVSSPHRGNLYIPWKRVINRDSSTQIHIARSTDEGVTWSQPIPVSNRFPRTSEATTFGQSFPLARTGPDGSVHLVWNSGTESSIRYSRSTDAGTTWTEPRVIQTYKPFGEKSTINGQTNSRVKGVVRAECYPTLTIDNTSGPRNGWLYLTWAADNFPNVYFSRSTDNGTSWLGARIVHSDTTNDQFWSWIALDPTNGEVAIMYSDSRDDAANILVNTYVSWSSNGGTTWLDRRVGNDLNDLRRNPFQGNTFAGDYSGCDFYNGIIYPSWVDMRNTYVNPADNDVYTAVVDTRAPSAPRTFSARTIPDRPTEIDLAWSAITSLSYGQPLPPDARIVIQRDGVPIDTLATTAVALTDKGLTKYRLYVYTLVVTADGRKSAPREASAYAGGSKELGAPVLISAKGNEDRTINIAVQIPVLRLDGVTPIINLAYLHSDLSEVPFVKSLSTSDTGKRVLHNVQPTEDGWYRVRERVFDSENNASTYSDSLWAYTGSLEPSPQSFTTEPRYHKLLGSWGRTTNFFKSAPASYAHSPVGAYTANRRDTVEMFPIAIVVTPEYPTLKMRYSVAAFVDPSDTMFLEVSKTGNKGDYTVAEWWNASRDARWTDTTKGDDAWRAVSTLFPAFNPGDTLHMRLRFKSNAVRQSDGFYIDDIDFDFVSGVYEELSLVYSISPNPSSSHINISLTQDLPVEGCRVIDVQGASHNVQWYQSGHTIVADVSMLPQGVYSIAIERASRSEQHRFVIIR
ncbi:MAG: T9SS type A sorting domain-containing protein [Candidatus Kapabacteria bacterium]|nr:T9SS type A sorting domain-containing protein [Candidatus Kapabacteria bacterium]